MSQVMMLFDPSPVKQPHPGSRDSMSMLASFSAGVRDRIGRLRLGTSSNAFQLRCSGLQAAISMSKNAASPWQKSPWGRSRSPNRCQDGSADT
jgi:hypothetical protein